MFGFLWKKKEDKIRWSEIAVDCLAVGTIMKYIYDYDVPMIVSLPALFGIMFASLFGVTRSIIAVFAFCVFIATYTYSYPLEGFKLIVIFVVYAFFARVFRKTYHI